NNVSYFGGKDGPVQKTWPVSFCEVRSLKCRRGPRCGPETNRQAGGAVNMKSPSWFPGFQACQLDVMQRVENIRKCDTSLQSRQWRTQAKMDAVSEGDV